MRQTISLLVLDLDNTLFDWFDIWYASFSAMLQALAEQSKVPIETLKKDFKAVHERHGTSEYAFAIEELPSLRALHPDGADLAQIYMPAIEAYRAARRSRLRLYPTVRETLERLRELGCQLVAYTESMAFYTGYRMRKTDLDLLLDHLYSPRDHDLPKNLTPEQIRKYPASHYELRRTVARHTPHGELKPNPNLLVHIIESVGGQKQRTVYVGDSQMKDIAMANAAGVTSVWAKYGASRPPEYELLRDVTHWTPADVQRERAILDGMSGADLVPTHTLHDHFAELLDLFDFVPVAAIPGTEVSAR